MLLSTTKLTDKILVHVGLFIHEVCLTFLNCAFLSLKRAFAKMPQSKLEILSRFFKFNSETYRRHQYKAHGFCISPPLLCSHRHNFQASLGADIVAKSSHFLCSVRKTSRLVRTLLQTVNNSRQ